MAPKGKKGKKQQDDWENEMGEDATTAQVNGGEPEDNPDPKDGVEPEDEMGGGGLLAALKKNKDRRKKKGKHDNAFVEGEDIAALANGDAPATTDDALAAKAPEEATFDDNDVFAGNATKKGKAGKSPANVVEDDDDDNDSVASGAVGGGVKSKKEKEKEKKEREKQRKKEQVGSSALLSVWKPNTDI